MYDWDTLNPKVIAEFRANGGKVEQFGNLPVVILHTIGARSGKVREIPLIVVIDGGQTLIFGTKAGAQKHPAWYFNLKAKPRIDVEMGDERYSADIVELPRAEAGEILRRQAEKLPQLAEYVRAASPRRIPVFSIKRI